MSNTSAIMSQVVHWGSFYTSRSLFVSQAATPIFRAINVRRIVRGAGTSAHEQSFPGGGQLWRGGGFCNDHIPVFEGLLNKKYRVRGYCNARWGVRVEVVLEFRFMFRVTMI